MAANLQFDAVSGRANMFYAGKTPWHGFGQNVEGDARYSIAACIEASNLDNPVGLKELYTKQTRFDEQGNAVVSYDEKPERYTYDEKTGIEYGCVGPRYTPLQNREAFSFFQPWLDTKQVSLHTAGALFGGSKVWIQAKIENVMMEVNSKDLIEAYIMLSNSHDGTTSIRVGFTPQRIVCSNTLYMAITNKLTQLIRIRHNRNVKTNLDNIRDVMDLTRSEFSATQEKYQRLYNRGISVADLRKFVKKMFDVEDVADTDIATRTKNNMEEVFKRFELESAIAGNTAWNAYNAFNYQLNWTVGRNTQNRLDSLWFGTNAGKDKQAFELALAI